MDLSTSTALVTGANRGFGRALAAELLGRGATVYAGARNPDQVDLPGAKPIALDITDPASVAAAAQATGDVTVLINNAGSSTGADLLTGDLDDIRLEMDTHFFGTLSVVRAFAPQIAANGGGAILNILSGLSWVSFPEFGAYCAAKSARVVAHQRPAPAARRPGHPGGRAARRLHGHRHGPERHRAQVRPRRHRPDRRRRHRRRRLRDPRGRRRPPGAGRAGRRRLRALPAAPLIAATAPPTSNI